MTQISAPTFERILKKAISKSAHEIYKYSAIIIKGNRIISVGVNYRNKTHPLSVKVNPNHTIHAEINALVRSVDKSTLRGANIVVYREDKFGNSLLARPCETCQLVLKDHGIKKMIYTDQNGDWIMENIK